jgi:hypothetical protein
MRVLACAVILAFVLAGCSGAADETSTSVDFSDKDLKATETTGVIRGVVVNQALAPLANATVLLVGKQKQASTDGTGRFGFDGLAAGTYFLQAKKPGYAGSQQSAEVKAGEAEPAAIKIQLLADASTQPYVLSQVYHGFISCGFKAVNFVFDASSCDPTGAAGYKDRDKSFAAFEAPTVPKYYQTEMTWKSNQPVGDQLVTIQWACEAQDSCGNDDFRLCNVRGPAPLVCRVNATQGGGGGGFGINKTELGGHNKFFGVQMFANCSPCSGAAGLPPDQVPNNLGVGAVTEQTFDLYTFLYYNYQPPPDWTFLGTGKVAPPPK